MAQTVNSGREIHIWNFTLSTTATKIVLNQKVNSLVIRCRTAVDLYLREGGAGDYFTIPAGSSLTLDINTNTYEPFYLSASTGTPVAEILGTLE